MISWDSKLVTFLSNGNTVKISGIRQFKSFNSLLKKIGLNLFKNDEEDFWRLVNDYKLEGTSLSFLVEYNNAKGIRVGWKSEEESESWFGIEPFTVPEILEEIKA